MYCNFGFQLTKTFAIFFSRILRKLCGNSLQKDMRQFHINLFREKNEIFAKQQMRNFTKKAKKFAFLLKLLRKMRFSHFVGNPNCNYLIIRIFLIFLTVLLHWHHSVYFTAWYVANYIFFYDWTSMQPYSGFRNPP